MKVFHSSGARRFGSGRQMRRGFNFERASPTSRAKPAAEDGSEMSHYSRPDVARHFMKMNATHDRIREEILRARLRKTEDYRASHEKSSI